VCIDAEIFWSSGPRGAQFETTAGGPISTSFPKVGVVLGNGAIRKSPTPIRKSIVNPA